MKMLSMYLQGGEKGLNSIEENIFEGHMNGKGTISSSMQMETRMEKSPLMS